MNPGKFSLLYNQIRKWKNRYRLIILKLRGLQAGKNIKTGHIRCDWPNKLRLGDGCDIQDDVDFRIWQPYNPDTLISVGAGVFIGHGCEFVCKSSITIGNDCLIASRTTFVDVGHAFKPGATIQSQEVTTAPITIGDDVWIGTSCVILQGVSIGNGSVIAAGSVVNKNIPENQVWAGVPARFIKYRKEP